MLCVLAGLDYTSLPSGTVVTFGPGRPSRACVRVPILEDSNDEPNERFRVNIEEEDDQISIQPGDDTATVTITDDDGIYYYANNNHYSMFFSIVMQYWTWPSLNEPMM